MFADDTNVFFQNKNYYSFYANAQEDLHKAALTWATFSCRESAFCLFSFSIALVSFFLDLRKKKGKMPILAVKSRSVQLNID